MVRPVVTGGIGQSIAVTSQPAAGHFPVFQSFCGGWVHISECIAPEAQNRLCSRWGKPFVKPERHWVSVSRNNRIENSTCSNFLRLPRVHRKDCRTPLLCRQV